MQVTGGQRSSYLHNPRSDLPSGALADSLNFQNVSVEYYFPGSSVERATQADIFLYRSNPRRQAASSVTPRAAWYLRFEALHSRGARIESLKVGRD